MIQIESVGGGQSSGTQGISVDAGGMAYPTTTGDSGFNWGTFGQGLQRTGSSFAQSGGASSGYGSTGGYQPASMQQAQPFDVNDQRNVIQPPKTDAEIQAFIDALRRLSSAGKSAASYYYVDPRAMTQQQAYDEEQGHIGQLLPYGTQPGF